MRADDKEGIPPIPATKTNHDIKIVNRVINDNNIMLPKKKKKQQHKQSNNENTQERNLWKWFLLIKFEFLHTSMSYCLHPFNPVPSGGAPKLNENGFRILGY